MNEKNEKEMNVKTEDVEKVVPLLFGYLYNDRKIISDEEKAVFDTLPLEEQFSFLMDAESKFFDSNAEYAEFMRIRVYTDPAALIEFFQNIKQSHFKKCGVRDDGRFKEMQKRLKAAETTLANNPVPLEQMTLKDAAQILNIRNIFTETELAAFYYYQHPHETETAVTEYPDNYNLPFGPWLFTLSEAITHAAADRGFYELTETSKKKNNRHVSVELAPLDKSKGFKLIEDNKQNGTHNEITIFNKDLIESTTALKIFCFLLTKAAQQNFRPEILFSLNELVNIGMYSSAANARAGLEEQMPAVQSVQMAGKFKKHKKSIDQGGGVLFYNHNIKNNIVSVSCNEKFNFEFLSSYYAMLPAWSWSLSDRAFNLMLHICMMIRTKRKTNFNISFRNIRDALALPTQEEYTQKGKKFKAGQYVKQPITRAIDEIINAAGPENDDIKIVIHNHIPDKKLDEWLNGYIEVSISGEFKKKINEIKKSQTKRIEENMKKSD